MKSFFSRHEVDKNALGFSQGEKGYPSAGRVAWDAWGGDAGFAWAESVVAESEKEVAKHNQGKHDQKTHGSWADGIAEEILAGGHPEVEPENLSAFLMKASKRTDHPDLTELSIKGTLLYGDEGMGIARKDMPQIPGKERGRFLSEIEASKGITAEKEKVDPTTLKPVQKEISASRSGAIYNKFRDEGGIPKDERILISSDGYVIDGHHTWGAAVAFAFDNKGTELPVYRLSVTAKEAMDVSLDALHLARENSLLNKLNVDFLWMDMGDDEFLSIENSFDLVVSNPPYIAVAEMHTMEKHVLNHEPHLALFAPDDDPLFFYRRIAAFSTNHLNPNGSIWLELNPIYADEISDIFRRVGMSDVRIYQDISGKDRFLAAFR
jgi:hypothetical protein